MQEIRTGYQESLRAFPKTRGGGVYIERLYEVLEQTAARFPDRPAFTFGTQTIAYGTLLSRALTLAETLFGLGIRPGDFLATLLPNHPLFVEAYFAANRLGAVLVPINPLYKATELNYMLGDCGAKAVLTLPPWQELCLAVSSSLPSAPTVLVQGGTPPATALLAPSAPCNLPPSPRTPDDPAVCLYTSGTVARPKGALLSAHNLIFDVGAMRGVLDVREDEVYVCPLPLFHSFAEAVCILLPVATGAHAVILERFHPQSVLDALATYGGTILPAVPAMYQALLGYALRSGARSLGRLKFAVSGGSALSAPLMAKFEAHFGAIMLEGNGPTESSPVAYCNPPYGVRKPGSVGPPIPGVAVQIADDNDQPLATGQIGEILIRGENVMLGYLGRPEETASTLRGGWLHTGDLGRMDEDGYVFIVDRKKDLILTGGLNVYPSEVEATIKEHPAVADAAVVAGPDARRGEAPWAFVVLKPDLPEPPDAQSIINFCRVHLANYKVPRRVIFRQDLPLNETGKVLRSALREEAAKTQRT